MLYQYVMLAILHFYVHKSVIFYKKKSNEQHEIHMTRIYVNDYIFFNL